MVYDIDFQNAATAITSIILVTVTSSNIVRWIACTAHSHCAQSNDWVFVIFSLALSTTQTSHHLREKYFPSNFIETSIAFWRFLLHRKFIVHLIPVHRDCTQFTNVDATLALIRCPQSRSSSFCRRSWCVRLRKKKYAQNFAASHFSHSNILHGVCLHGFFIMHSQTFAGTTSHSNEVIDTSFGPNSPPQPCLPHVITEHLRSKESSRKQVKNKNTENRDSCRWFSYSVNKYAIEVSSWRRSLSRLRENIVVHINTHKPNMYACRLSLMVVGARNFLLQVNCAITAGTDREQKINIQINTFSSMLLKVVRLLATHVKLWQLAKDTANATAID